METTTVYWNRELKCFIVCFPNNTSAYSNNQANVRQIVKEFSHNNKIKTNIHWTSGLDFDPNR